MKGFDLQKLSKESAARLDAYVKGNFEQLVSEFIDCFSKYCDKIYKMQQQGKKGAIAYIHFSVLRTNILLRKHEIRIDAYDENWYMDCVECSGVYKVEKIFSYLEEYENAIEELRNVSGGKVSLAEIQKRIFDECNLYILYIAELIRAGMRNAVKTEAFKSMERNRCFVVCIGGFMDRFDILYKEDHTVKDSKEVKRFLQSKNHMLFSHAIYENLDLSKGNYEELEFQYSSFAGCDFTESSLNKSRFLFSSFKNTILKNVKMEKTKIFDTDFSGAVLECVSFTGAKLKHISFAGATLSKVDFSGAIVAEKLDFKDAIIVDCNIPERR